MKPTRRVSVERVDTHGPPKVRATKDDAVVVEEPLEIRVAGDTLAVTMRTPGNDRELVLGFLWAEGIIQSPGDVSGLAHCDKVEDDARGNVVEVALAPGVKPPGGDDSPFAKRGTVTTSACGVCGRRSIDDLLARVSPVTDETRVRASVIADAMGHLRDRQPIFAESGGCHAASLVRGDGEHVVTLEDVGRHNAVDKVIGARVRAQAMPLSGHVLLVSGRASFEIVQKAAAAGIPVVASVSAASSLAIDVARAANVTLICFARDGAFTVCSAGERVV